MQALRIPKDARVQPLERVTRLHCYQCGCHLLPDAIVYRPFFGGYDHKYCARCFAVLCETRGKSQEWKDRLYHEALHYGFAEPRTCACCGRPYVMALRHIDSMRWVANNYQRVQQIRRRNCCSAECEARLRRAQQRKPRPCGHCGIVFSPPRIDALFCSVACKQAAYRLRQHRSIHER